MRRKGLVEKGESFDLATKDATDVAKSQQNFGKRKAKSCGKLG